MSAVVRATLDSRRFPAAAGGWRYRELINGMVTTMPPGFYGMIAARLCARLEIWAAVVPVDVSVWSRASFSGAT